MKLITFLLFITCLPLLAAEEKEPDGKHRAYEKLEDPEYGDNHVQYRKKNKLFKRHKFLAKIEGIGLDNQGSNTVIVYDRPSKNGKIWGRFRGDLAKMASQRIQVIKAYDLKGRPKGDEHIETMHGFWVPGAGRLTRIYSYSQDRKWVEVGISHAFEIGKLPDSLKIGATSAGMNWALTGENSMSRKKHIRYTFYGWINAKLIKQEYDLKKHLMQQQLYLRYNVWNWLVYPKPRFTKTFDNVKERFHYRYWLKDYKDLEKYWQKHYSYTALTGHFPIKVLDVKLKDPLLGEMEQSMPWLKVEIRTMDNNGHQIMQSIFGKKITGWIPMYNKVNEMTVAYHQLYCGHGPVPFLPFATQKAQKLITKDR
jgi:hypothetical protein